MQFLPLPDLQLIEEAFSKIETEIKPLEQNQGVWYKILYHFSFSLKKLQEG